MYTPTVIPKVSIPEGQSGEWRVKKFVVDEKKSEHDELMNLISGTRRYVRPGEYTGLYRGHTIVMSDTTDEMNDHRVAVRNAHNHCLVFGLGIGMVIVAMLEKPEVTKVTVVELSQDVINLTGPTLKERYGDRLEIIQANGLEWKPPKGVHYGVVWADIWDTITADNLPEMTKFNRRYCKRATWYGNWGEEICRENEREYKKAQKGRRGFFW